MILRRTFLWSLLLLLLCACTPTRKVTAVPGTNDSLVSFTIVQMNDVYEIAPIGNNGGLARVATVIDELKAENPNVISVLAGDFLSPSFSNTLRLENGDKIAGLQMIETLNAIGLDYATFGNHEFDFSDVDLLQKRIDAGTFRYMSSNVRQVTDSGLQRFHQRIDGQSTAIPDYLVHTFTNPSGRTLRVALVGTTLAFAMQPYVEYLPWDTEFIRAMHIAVQNTDLVLGLTHLNIEQDRELAAQALPIPLFMGGHEHDQQSDYIENTAITKADANAKTIYVHRIRHDLSTGMTQVRSSVVPIDDQIADKPSVAAIVERWQGFSETAIVEMGYDPDRVIYRTDVVLEGTEVAVRSRQTNYGQLTNEAFRATWPGADVYLFNGGSLRVDDNLVGDITEYDILRSFPFGGDFTAISMPGQELIRLLDAGRKDNLGKGGYLQVLGATLKNGSWQVADQAIDPTRSYRIVLPSFVASGREANLDFLSAYATETRPTLTLHGEEVKNDVRNVLIAYLSRL